MVRVFYLRHAESTANRGPYTFNAPLSSDGQAQALKLRGYFTYVLCSPLTRCRKTLELSKITYEHLSIVYKLREKSDVLIPEFRYTETDEEFNLRIRRFERELRDLCKTCSEDDTILIVGHGLFYWHWMEGKLPDIYNAEIVQIPRAKYV